MWTSSRGSLWTRCVVVKRWTASWVSPSRTSYEPRVIYHGKIFSVPFLSLFVCISLSHRSSSRSAFFPPGFVEKEIKKADIPIVDTGENPEVPFPRDMIDLEVLNGLKRCSSIMRVRRWNAEYTVWSVPLTFLSKYHITSANASTRSEESTPLMWLSIAAHVWRFSWNIAEKTSDFYLNSYSFLIDKIENPQ